MVWLWAPSVNSSISSFMFHYGSFYVNKSMSVFASIVVVFGSFVKFYGKYFGYWMSCKE